MRLAFTLLLYHLVKPHIQHIMQIYVCTYRRNQSTLGCTPVAFVVFHVLHDACFQKPLDVPQKILVRYIMLQKSHQPLMVYIVEEPLYVRINNEVYLICHYQLVYFPYCLMTILAFSEAVGEIIELPLVYLVKHLPHCSLHQFILICRYPQRPHLVASRFGYICPSHRLWPIAEHFHSGEQVLYVRFEVFPIGFLAHSVYTRGFAFMLLPVFFSQILFVYIVHQRLRSLVFLYLLRYSFVRIFHLLYHLQCG